jgi:hypothetical protein
MVDAELSGESSLRIWMICQEEHTGIGAGRDICDGRQIQALIESLLTKLNLPVDRGV